MLNGLSFLAVITALLQMRIAPQGQPTRRGSAWAQLGEGIRYIAAEKTIRTLIVLVASMSFFGIAAVTLFPAWAVRVLGGDATTNGLLLSARGLGSLISALLIAALGRFDYKGRLLTAGTFAFPVLLLAFALTRWLPLALLALVGVGMAAILVMNLANALVQSLVPDSLRGRVMSVYSMTFFGLMPLGALWVGSLAEYASAPRAVILAALLLLGVATIAWFFAPRVRQLK
jgi:MFS family permease